MAVIVSLAGARMLSEDWGGLSLWLDVGVIDLSLFEEEEEEDSVERRKSRDSHQSNSVMLSIPQSLNHFLLPRGAKNWTRGWRD